MDENGRRVDEAVGDVVLEVEVDGGIGVGAERSAAGFFLLFLRDGSKTLVSSKLAG